MKKISVVTICFNCETEIERTLISVKSQRNVEFEYIVIDGGSIDNTLNILKKYSKNISKLISEPDDGISDAFNKGIRSSSGEFIIFLNAGDVFYDSNALSSIYSKLDDDVDIYCGSVLCNNKVHKSFPKLLPLGMYIRHPGSATRRTVFEASGYFKLNIRAAMDYDIMLRAYILKFKFKSTRDILVRMAQPGQSSNVPLIVAEEGEIRQRVLRPHVRAIGNFFITFNRFRVKACHFFIH